MVHQESQRGTHPTGFLDDHAHNNFGGVNGVGWLGERSLPKPIAYPVNINREIAEFLQLFPSSLSGLFTAQIHPFNLHNYASINLCF